MQNKLFTFQLSTNYHLTFGLNENLSIANGNGVFVLLGWRSAKKRLDAYEGAKIYSLMFLFGQVTLSKIYERGTND